MKKLLIILITLNSVLFGVGEAGAIFLLISPGAKSQGMGEAMVANTGTSLMSYYNPAALSFLNSNSISMSYVNWLPNMPNIYGNDNYHRFISLNYKYNEKHSFGVYYINLNLGRFDDDEKYMSAVSISYAFRLSNISSIGLNAKSIYQNVLNSYADIGEHVSKNTAYDLSYFRQINNISFGMQLANMGSTIQFSSLEEQEDPAPTNLSLGLAYKLDVDETSKIKLLFQADKLLVTRYQMMDWDGDGYVGGYDEYGSWISEKVGEYNIDGKKEYDRKGYFDDPWYLAIFTAWLDDWYLGGDIDYDGDAKIGGWTWDETMDMDGDGEPDIDELVEDESGVYGRCVNDEVCKEKGTGDNRSFNKELEEMTFKYGIEYNFIEKTFLRIGYIHDFEGKIFSPTFGFGFAIENLMLDYGYTGGKRGAPRENTHFFSLEYKLPPITNPL